MNEQAIGIIRTLVQAAAGALITWLATLGIELDAPAVELILFAVATAAYRELVSFAARRWPAVEWLNGYPSQPQYDTAA